MRLRRDVSAFITFLYDFTNTFALTMRLYDYQNAKEIERLR